MRDKVMILGYGSAGQYLVDKLLNDNLDIDIVVVSRNPDKSLPRLELSKVAIALREDKSYPTNLEFEQADFFDTEQLASVIKKHNPATIVYVGRFLSGHKYGSYSYPHGIGYGAWIPMSAAPVYAVMKAVRLADVDSVVINTSLPDAVNPWLRTVGLSPHTGAGNVAHVVPRIQRAVTELLTDKDLSTDQVDVELFCSHYGNTKISKEGYCDRDILLNIYVGDEKLDINQDKVLELSMDNTASGPVRNIMISTDCHALVRALHNNRQEGQKTKLHLPGVLGLVGGYPAIVDTTKTTPAFSIIHDREEVINSDAIRELESINKSNLRGDGIDKFEDGKVYFTHELITKMKEVYGIEYPEYLHIDQAEEFAKEIATVLSNLD